MLLLYFSFLLLICFIDSPFQLQIDSTLLNTNESTLIKPNKWINLVIKKIVFQLTGMKFDHLDVGASVPHIKCLFLEEKLNEQTKQNGFVCYEKNERKK